MKRKQESIDSLNSCEHCGRTFVRDSTLLKHLCEQKRRWQDQERPGNRIGFNAWLEFYASFQPSRKKKDYKTFISSPYYSAFVKFGNYCMDVRAINVAEFIRYLLKNNIPIDNWNSDRVYTTYLIDYLKTEDAFDAVKRSIENMLKICDEEHIRIQDIFKYYNSNKLCHMITAGRISPWVLYNSNSGVGFLESLNVDQQAVIFEYIDPERWMIKMKRDTELTTQIKQLLTEAGL